MLALVVYVCVYGASADGARLDIGVVARGGACDVRLAGGVVA
jgi:hypothetical protein